PSLAGRQHGLDPAEVDMAVDLGGGVLGSGHVVGDQRPPFENGDLSGLGANVGRHQVAPEGAALALAAPPLGEGFLVEGLGFGLDRRACAPAVSVPASPAGAAPTAATTAALARSSRG